MDFLKSLIGESKEQNSHQYLMGGCLLFVASSQFWLQTYEAQIDGIKIFGIKSGYEDAVAKTCVD